MSARKGACEVTYTIHGEDVLFESTEDFDADAIYVGRKHRAVDRTVELPTYAKGFGVNVDLDAAGNIVGVELLGYLS